MKKPPLNLLLMRSNLSTSRTSILDFGGTDKPNLSHSAEENRLFGSNPKADFSIKNRPCRHPAGVHHRMRSFARTPQGREKRIRLGPEPVKPTGSGQEANRRTLFYLSSSLILDTTFSGVNPYSSMTLPPGAEAPNVSIPRIAPASPT